MRIKCSMCGRLVDTPDTLKYEKYQAGERVLCTPCTVKAFTETDAKRRAEIRKAAEKKSRNGRKGGKK